MNITFTNTWELNLDKPNPSSKHIPSWYKDMESYINSAKVDNKENKINSTIKRCMPVFDAMSAGYIITLPVDVDVFIPEDETLWVQGKQHFKWSIINPIKFHPIEQAPTHPNRVKHNAYPKWINPWSIKTPEGYSTLFVQPMHRDSVFTIFPGVVDTDQYFAPIHFPMVINDPDFEGRIPKGTPIAQVIPFKRDIWELELGGIEDFKQQQNITNKLNNRVFNKYKAIFRKNKEYR